MVSITQTLASFYRPAKLLFTVKNCL